MHKTIRQSIRSDPMKGVDKAKAKKATELNKKLYKKFQKVKLTNEQRKVRVKAKLAAALKKKLQANQDD